MKHRFWLRLLLPCLGIVLVDVALSSFAIDDGLFQGDPLPPFGPTPHPRQRAWLEAQRDGGARGQGLHELSRFDADLGWTYRAPSRSADGAQEISALGSRGSRSYSKTKPEGKMRLVCFGDSFTYCDFVPDGEDWPALLEERAPDVEAINFGVSGYGTDQALLRFRRDGRDLGADVLVIGVMLENIGRNVNRYRPLWFPKTKGAVTKPRFILGADGIELLPQPFESREAAVEAVASGRVLEQVAQGEYWLHRPALGLLRFSSIARIVGGRLAQRERDPARLWTETDGEPYRVTLAILEAFRREALAAGAREAVVLIFPRMPDLQRLVEEGESYWTPLIRDLEASGVRAIDLAPVLAQIWDREKAGGGLYVRGHLNRKGNDVVATLLDSWLD